jgi:hypothetical protein
MKKKPEYIEGSEALENFERALDAVVKAPHSEIKAKLDAEKAAKTKKRKPKTSAIRSRKTTNDCADK